MQTGFIVAIDLGTSKITGVVGRRNESNVISVLAQESIPSEGSIRRGLVYNTEETGAKVQKLINMLENKLGRKIGQVYVSLAGQSLHTEVYRDMRQLSSSGIVTEDVVSQMREAVDKYKPDSYHKYAVADVEYFVDDRPESNPVGVSCSYIEAEYEIIVGRQKMIENIRKSIPEKLHLPVADFIVGPQASAAIALSDEEKELGCAFIDFGAGTTTLSVYKNNILRHLVVIPFGGKNITKDICELNFVENEAEQYKIKFGKAKDSQDTGMFTSPFSSKPDIDLVELNNVIRMRLDEIVVNIKEQIRLSGYEGQLGAGVLITGGASQLKHLDLYLAEKLDMPVKRVSSKKTLINNSPDLANDPSLTQVLGMLLFGTKNCEEVKTEMAEEPHDSHSQTETRSKHEKKKKGGDSGKQKTSMGERIGSIFSGLFAEEEGDDNNDDE